MTESIQHFTMPPKIGLARKESWHLAPLRLYKCWKENTIRSIGLLSRQVQNPGKTRFYIYRVLTTLWADPQRPHGLLDLHGQVGLVATRYP